MSTVRVRLPPHLRNLARIEGETHIEITPDDAGVITIARVLDAVETAYPMLRGTIRDHASKQRRAFIRFFACGEDWSHVPQETALPEAIVTGREPFQVVGAMAGG